MENQTGSKLLSKEALAQVARVGGEGIRGRGRLQGEVALEGRVTRLITFGKGTRSEVSFTTDLPGALGEMLSGQTVWLSGTIHKRSAYGGTLKRARLVRPRGVVLPGDHLSVSGHVEQRHPMGIGGEAPPSGSYLRLTQPLQLLGQSYDELFLEREFGSSAQVTLYGRVEQRRYGGVETAARSYLALSGVSDVGAGEPRFDGVRFLAAREAVPLRRLVLEPREMYDAPNLILVLDPQAQQAFLGTQGGHMLPGRNPFHGFTARAPISAPTAADEAALRFSAEGATSAATGEPLDEVGRAVLPSAQAPDHTVHTWYYDDGADIVYQCVRGGIAGLANHLEAVIRLPDDDEPPTP